MTPEQASSLAARTLAAIDAPGPIRYGDRALQDADRARVASDLAGLRFATAEADRRGYESGWTNWRHVAWIFEDGLIRTAALYGCEVTA